MHIRHMLRSLEISDPYQGWRGDLEVDLQGWSSEHPYFATFVAMTNAEQIIEVGTWKGASAINMARHAKAARPDATVLCVDTWLGSNATLWKDDELRPLLRLQHGSPRIYDQFLTNVIASSLTDTIFPLPMTSISAAELLTQFEIRADLIYIDGAHGEYEVYGDLIHYWNLVRPGGIMFGDDYYTTWQGVITAVNRFAYEQRLGLETSAGKWFFRKPD